MQSLDDLKRRFGGVATLRFEDLGAGLVMAHVSNVFATASVVLQGAHITAYQPCGQEPLIWLSSSATFAPGKSIRGGVPVCWPWFGPHAGNAQFPSHGYARTAPWQLSDAKLLPDRRTRLTFELIPPDTARAQWPHRATLRNVVTIGPELEVQLATRNTGSDSFELGQALHAYFQVGDVRHVTLHGLHGCEYIDKLAGTRRRQEGPVDFTRETDRIYIATAGCCEIRDPTLRRSILVTACGSRSTVVWNPWTEKAQRLGDFAPQAYLAMVCVETANAAADVVTLRPGEEHVMAAQYRLLPP